VLNLNKGTKLSGHDERAAVLALANLAKKEIRISGSTGSSPVEEPEKIIFLLFRVGRWPGLPVVYREEIER